MRNLSRRRIIHLGLSAAFAPFAGATFSCSAEAAPLALRGYDPVAYFTLGTPARGVSEFEYEWDEHRYRFLQAEHREMFKADPVRYAPQFAGFCAVALARGEVEEANPEYWLVSDGKLYLFGKPIGPALFQRDLAGNIAKASENQPLIVNR